MTLISLISTFLISFSISLYFLQSRDSGPKVVVSMNRASDSPNSEAPVINQQLSAASLPTPSSSLPQPPRISPEYKRNPLGDHLGDGAFTSCFGADSPSVCGILVHAVVPREYLVATSTSSGSVKALRGCWQRKSLVGAVSCF